MSQSTSPSTNKPYGVAAVARAWQVPRSTFYAVKARQGRQTTPLAKRGPKTDHSDAELTELIRQQIAASPFHGEGHRKIWARLRFADVRTSKPRVLRLMREAQLLAPARRPHTAEHEHNGQIITEGPNQMWGTDGTTTVTLKEGTATIFAAIDHYSADCVGIHVAKRGTRFEALEPLRQGVREYFGGFGSQAAAGLILRHDHGTQYMSEDFQKEVEFLGMTSSPSFVRQPEGKGRVERNFQTAQDRLVKGMRVAGVTTLEQANRYLEEEYLAWWDGAMTVDPASSQDGHRPLEASHDLASALSHVETRKVKNDHTFQIGNVFYRIQRESIVAGLRGSAIRVEQRLDGTVAARFRDRFLAIQVCEKPAPAPPPEKRARVQPRAKGKSEWNKNFDLHDAPPIWKAAQGSGYRRKGNR